FVFSYLRDDGSFALVVKRGSGDCPAGCTDNEYWYFETDAKCAPQALGHYHAGFDYSANCITIEGERHWNVPRAIDPTSVCGERNDSQSISGAHHFHATGMRWPCALSGQRLDPIQVDKMITIEIAQNAADLSRCKVTVSGLGESWLDGRSFDA